MTQGSLQAGFRALVIGFYGAPNVGDEALLDIVLHRIHELGGEAMVVSIDPLLTTRMHGVRSVDYTNLGEVVKALQLCDVVIMGGGGIFQDHHPFHLEALYLPNSNDIAAYARPLMAAIQLGIPYLIWGHGVGPLQRPAAQDVVREVFNHARAASVRDEASLQLLRRIGVSKDVLVAPDPGWLFSRYHPLSPDPCPQQDAPVLAVVLREWEKGQWKNALAGALRAVVPVHWRIHWISFQTPGETSGAVSDMPLIEEVRDLVGPRPGDRVHTPATPQQAWELLGACDAVFSMRLHASILSLLAGKPTSALEYDDKLAHAHQMAGMPDAMRLKIGEPQSRFEQALQMTLAGQWRPDPATIRQLSDAAVVHLDLLDGCLSAESGQGSLDATRMDWMACWLQQSLRELAQVSRSNRAAHELLEFRQHQLDHSQDHIAHLQSELNEVDNSRRAAHELLAYRDYQLLHKDEEASRLKQQVALLEESLATARERAVERDKELAGLQVTLAKVQQDCLEQNEQNVLLRRTIEGLGEQATQVRAQWQRQEQVLSDEVSRLKVELQSLGEELRMSHDQQMGLEERLREMEISLADVKDELLRKDAYIQDKEMYIAMLQQQVGELTSALQQSREETEQARDIWRRIRLGLGIARRDAIRTLAAPFTLAAVARRHGWRVALKQIPNRLRTLGTLHPNGQPAAPAAALAAAMPVYHVRKERMLVLVNEAVDSDGWPSRAMSLALGAARAGFQTLVFPAGVAPDHSAVSPDIARLQASRSDWQTVVHDADTRILLAELTEQAVSLAEEAHSRGATVLVDLPSLADSSINDALWRRVDALGARKIHSRQDTGDRLDLWLPDAGDNEIFDSYRSHPRPDTYSSNRANILVILLDDEAETLLQQCLAARHDALFHVTAVYGHPPGITDKRLRIMEWSWNPQVLASRIAAADGVVLLGDDRASACWTLRLHHAVLLLERPLVAQRPLDLASRNLHRLEVTDLPQLLRLHPQEDYAFIAANTWLERTEKLLHPAYPGSVSVIVLIHNNRRIIERCVATLLQHAGQWLQEIVVVDNQSSDGGAELVEELFGSDPRVVLTRNSENGCSSGRNLGVRHATGKYLAFFDSDQWVTSPSCFAEAVSILERDPSVGAIGWNAGWFDDSRDDLGGPISDYLPNRGMNPQASAQGYRTDIGFLGTSCMFMTRELFDALEGFDPFYDPTCFEDTDICFQIRRAGKALAFRDLAGVRHQPHQTTGASEGSERYRKLFERNAAYFRHKWKDHPDFFVNLTSWQ